MAVIDNLRLSTEAMRTAINDFNNRKTALENAYLKISNEVRTLDGTWHGEASEKFKGQFDKLYQNLKQNETVMSNVISNLETALDLYEEFEDQAKTLIQNAAEGKVYESQL